MNLFGKEMTELLLRCVLLAVYYRITLLGPGFAIPAPLSGTLRVDAEGRRQEFRLHPQLIKTLKSIS